ncbi:hypothetical protein BH23BAC3_BH23BAC3_10760 [soil metagenome]
MKKIIKFLIASISIFLLLNGCSERGPMGPEGPSGAQGPAGPTILPTSFEFEIDLLRANNFEYYQDIPSQIEVFNSDMILAYVLEDFIPEDDLDVWRKLPLTEFNDRGTLQLDFDFTAVDMHFFLHSNYTLGSADELDGLLIRAVHIPADFLNSNKAQKILDAETYDEIEMIIGSEMQSIKLN